MHARKTRLLAATGVLAMSVTALTACSASSGGNQTLRIYTPYPEMYDIPLAALADAYEEANPGWTVKVESTPYSGYADALQTQFMGGTAADILLLEPPEITAFSSKGYLSDLSEPLASDGWADTFLGTSVSQIRAQDGKDYAAPWALIDVKLQYNEKLYADAGVSTPPTTWTEQLAANDKLQAAGVQPFWFGLDGSDANVWWRLTLMLNAGFRTVTDDINLRHADGWSYDSSDPDTISGEAYTADEKYVAFVNGITDPLTSDIYQEALDLILELQPYTGDSSAWSAESSGSAFTDGTLAQTTGVDASLPNWARDSAEAGFDFTYGSVPLPAVTDAEWPALTDGPTNPLASVRNGLSVNAAASNQEQAVDFVKFATSIEGQDILYDNGWNDDDEFLIGQSSAVAGVTYPEGSGLSDSEVTMVPELSLYGFGMPPTYDSQDMDEFNNQLQQLWTGAITKDEFLQQRHDSNLAALERNLQVYASEVDQAFIDENTK